MAEISDAELDEIYVFAQELGKQAGKMLMNAAMARCGGSGSGEQAHVEKENAVDLVTQTDEGRLVLSIHDAFLKIDSSLCAPA